MNGKIRFIIVLLVAISLFSCQKEKDAYVPDYGYDYYPLEIGKTWVYKIDSIQYDTINLGTIADTATYYSKEEIVSSSTDENGNIVYVIEESRRMNDSLPWTVANVWSASVSDDKAYKTEGNFKFIKLVFPVKENTYWDGNALFESGVIFYVKGESIEVFKEWDYYIQSTGEQEVIGDISYNNVATVVEADYESAIELRKSVAKYAKGIGLVSREMHILDTQNITEDQPWEEKAQKGFIFKQVLVSHN